MAANNGMIRVINAVMAGVLIGIMAVVFLTSYSSIIFAGDLARFLPNGIGIALASATIMATVVALVSSHRGMIAVPQDINSVVFGVAAAAMAATITAAGGSLETVYATVIAAMLLTTAVTGLIFFALGYFRLGGLIRFIPYPVIGGFLAATGWLLVDAAVQLMTGLSIGWDSLAGLIDGEVMAGWLPGLVYGAALLAVTRRFTHFLVFPTVLVGSIVVFHLFLLASGLSLAAAQAKGWLLGPFPEGGLWTPVAPSLLVEADWGAVAAQLPGLATIPLLSVIGLLLNASALEITIQRDVDLNRELRAAGLGNMLAVLGGGMSGYQYLSLSTLSYRMRGESRLVGVVVALVCGATLLLGTQVMYYFPKLVLGGVISFLGFGFLVEWLIDVRRRLPVFEYAVILLIFFVAGTIGFLEAVAVGILASTILFIVKYSRINVVRHALSGRSYRSNVARTEDQAGMLRETGRVMLILKLQGFIFFGTANKLLDDIRQRARREVDPVRYVLMDFGMVNGLDSSAVMCFIKLHLLALSDGLVLVMTNLSPGLRDQMEACGLSLEPQPSLHTFADFDRGVEWCENDLLRAQGVDPRVESEAVAELLTRELPDDVDACAVMAYMERQDVDEGRYLTRQGERADDLFFIESGQVTVLLELEEGAVVRLLTTGLGTIGEIGLYTGLERTASVVAEAPSVVYRLTLAALDRMEREDPRLAAAFHKFIARRLATRLADTTRVLREVLE